MFVSRRLTSTEPKQGAASYRTEAFQLQASIQAFEMRAKLVSRIPYAAREAPSCGAAKLAAPCFGILDLGRSAQTSTRRFQCLSIE
jgi:hypothetical protein